jgi:hypothetical protein
MRRQVPRPVIAIYALLGVFTVHALRYAAFPEPDPHGGHGYLSFAPPLLGGLLAIAVVQLAVDRRAPGGPRHGWRTRWILATLAFLALYAAQENAEALATTSRLAGPGALLGHGGWIVLPLTVAAGGLLAALLRGTEAVLARLAHAPAALPRLRHAARTATARGRSERAPRTAGIARHLAGRAPPARA